MSKLFAIAPGVLALLLPFFSGCSDAPQIVEVSGVVTRGGQPVPGLTVNFMPADGRPSWGLTDAEGKFTLHYNKQYEGARVGKHKVFVVFRASSPQEEMDLLSGKIKPHPDQRTIAEKYGNPATTPLEIEVSTSGQVINLALD